MQIVRRYFPRQSFPPVLPAICFRHYFPPFFFPPFFSRHYFPPFFPPIRFGASINPGNEMYPLPVHLFLLLLSHFPPLLLLSHFPLLLSTMTDASPWPVDMSIALFFIARTVEI